MRRGIAHFLRALANRIHSDDHHDTVEVIDSYGICRCRLGIAADETHGVDSEYTLLPEGWMLQSREE